MRVICMRRYAPWIDLSDKGLAAIAADAKLKCGLCIVGASATSQMGSRCGEKADH
jgi:hypothetical protein